MKNMKGRILRKLKTIPTPTWKPSLIFQANTPVHILQSMKEQKIQDQSALLIENHCIAEIVKDDKEVKTVSGPNANTDQKLVQSELKPDKFVDAPMQLLEDFDPSLEIITSSVVETVRSPSDEENEGEDCNNDNYQSTPSFEEKCPPGGKESVVLYTTSLRGIRKTFEDCNAIRFLLESFRVLYHERDVSMHLEYREELWGILGGRIVPPRLFVKGRYIGGADEVVGLHEKGLLKNLFQGMPLSPSSCPCVGCAGMRFVLCLNCNGSRKVMPEGTESGVAVVKCPDCNENGLIKCPECSQQ